MGGGSAAWSKCSLSLATTAAAAAAISCAFFLIVCSIGTVPACVQFVNLAAETRLLAA